jgi:tRNA G10  N-methylase Trm11
VTPVAHPAKFSDSILECIDSVIHKYRIEGVALDPFSGVGRIHELDRPRLKVFGMDIEREWAFETPDNVVGDAFHLPFREECLDALITSPTYGNRMADHHNAKDGSKRLTYTHTLGHELHRNNTGKMQWGTTYRFAHIAMWDNLYELIKPGGFVVLNVSDHYRKYEIQFVSQFHVKTLAHAGIKWIDHYAVQTPRMGFGANSELRVNHENVFVGVKPLTS